MPLLTLFITLIPWLFCFILYLTTKDEFKLLETVMSSAAKERKQAQDNPDGGEEGGGEGGSPKDEGKAFDDDDHGLQRAHKVILLISICICINYG